MKPTALAFAAAFAATLISAPAFAEWRGSFSATPFPPNTAMAAACANAFAIQGGVFGTVRAKFPNVAGNGNTTNITLFSDHIAILYDRTGSLPSGVAVPGQPINVRLATTTLTSLTGVKARYVNLAGATNTGVFVLMDMIVEKFNGVNGCTVRLLAPLYRTPSL
jgi:hypothetical protein